MAKPKKYFNAKNKQNNLNDYLQHQKYIKKLDHWKAQQARDIRNTTQLSSDDKPLLLPQQFQLPYISKQNYVSDFFFKYLFLTTFMSLFMMMGLLIFEDTIQKITHANLNQFIQHTWFMFLLFPIIILLTLIPFTPYRQQLIQNYRVNEDSFDIIYSNGEILKIPYQDIYSAQSIYAGTAKRFLEISYHCKQTQYRKNLTLANQRFSLFHAFSVAQDEHLFSAFLQQLRAKHPKAWINPLFLFMHHIDEETLYLDHAALKRSKRIDLIFWMAFLFIMLLIAFYPR